MRSNLTESRPVYNTASYARPDFGFQPPVSPTPKPETKSSRRFTFAPSEGWLPLLLLSVAVYSVVYSVTAAITIDHTNILWITTALGLLTGLLISKSRLFPQAVLHIGACIIGYWLAVFLTSMLAYHVSVLSMLSVLRTVFTGGFALTGAQGSNMIFLFYLSFLCFFLGYFGSWLIYRAHLPWLVALVYISIMIVNLNYAGKDELSFLILILVGSLILLIARVQLASQLAQWKSDGLYTDTRWLRGMANRFLRIATLFVVLILPFSWLLPVLAQPASGTTFWNGLDNAWANLVHGNLPSWNNPGAFFTNNAASSAFFTDQLTITGSISLPSGTVLSYKSSDGMGHYLVSFTFDTFDGYQRWTSQVGSVSQSYNASVRLPIDNSNASYDALTTDITILQPPGGTKHYIFAPPVPGSLTVPTTLLTDSGGNFVSAWTQTNPLRPNESYKATSELLNVSAEDLSNIPLPSDDPRAWSNDPNYYALQQYYLQKPGNLPPEILATAKQWIGDADTAYEAVSRLRDHLRNPGEFTYSLVNDPIPAKTDVVTWLLHTHKGYCTSYASAMIVMARLMGIPARMANGFSQGHYDARQKVWIVDGSDAHSWVQIYFPAYGWVNFDPTPGFVGGNEANPSVTPSPNGTQTPTANDPTHTPQNPTPGPQVTATAPAGSGGASGDSTNTSAGGRVLTIFSLIVLLCSLAVLGLSITRYRKRASPGSQSSPVTKVYTRLCRLASLLGTPPALWQTPYEFTFTLSRRFPQASTGLRRVADLFVRDRWAGPHRALAQAEAREVEQIWPRLRNTILRSPFAKKRR
ncbi:MAG TPA: transglutaminase domain-containing protein [Ktedonobacteraceae bacterium]|nr:transglutaminase domain-containing protein [Ktedonobacteraceae bacterium]